MGLLYIDGYEGLPDRNFTRPFDVSVSRFTATIVGDLRVCLDVGYNADDTKGFIEMMCKGKYGPHDLNEVGTVTMANGRETCRECRRITKLQNKRKARKRSHLARIEKERAEMRYMSRHVFSFEHDEWAKKHPKYQQAKGRVHTLKSRIERIDREIERTERRARKKN